MADYAYGCLLDEALDWFEELDNNVKQDWSKLRPAIIAKFPKSKSSKAVTSRSRIKAVRENGIVLGYVASMARAINHKLVAKADEGLIMDIPLRDTQQTAAYIQMASHGAVYSFVGLEVAYYHDSNEHWNFRACEAGEYTLDNCHSLI
ncbi:hypothetical protein FRB95_013136 [Tulasnella sp. JGI-2019a]|nr:hypothetical protein FRB95_013136 [Tulasnella sp. JGI-2019a]